MVLAASSYALIGLNLIQGILFVPLYLHYIGSLLYGAWLATGSIISYLSLFDLGLNSVIMQKVAEADGANDLERRRSYMGSGLCVSFALSYSPY